MIKHWKERRFFTLFGWVFLALVCGTAEAQGPTAASVLGNSGQSKSGQVKTSPSPTPGITDKSQIPDALSLKLERALSESVPQLGAIEPWQERLFTEEVLREPQRFIRDYRASRTGIDVDVDLESIKHYIRFYSPLVYKKESPQIAIDAVPIDNCEPCQAKAPAIRQILKDRLMRRGFNVLMTKPIEQDALSRFAQEKKAEGTLWVNFGPAPADETDSAHSDEIRYSIKAVMNLQGYPKQEGTLEIFETGSFERSVSRLLTDFFTEVGSKTNLAQGAAANASDGDSGAITIEVRGIKSYAQFVKLRDKVHSVGETALIPVEERKVSSGKVIFIARPEKKDFDGASDKLKKGLGGVVIGGKSSDQDGSESGTRGRLHVLNASDQRLEMEIRP